MVASIWAPNSAAAATVATGASNKRVVLANMPTPAAIKITAGAICRVLPLAVRLGARSNGSADSRHTPKAKLCLSMTTEPGLAFSLTTRLSSSAPVRNVSTGPRTLRANKFSHLARVASEGLPNEWASKLVENMAYLNAGRASGSHQGAAMITPSATALTRNLTLGRLICLRQLKKATNARSGPLIAANEAFARAPNPNARPSPIQLKLELLSLVHSR